MRLNKKQSRILLAVIGIITISTVSLIVGIHFWINNQNNGNDLASEDPIGDDGLTFVEPLFISSFLDEEGGITIYFDAEQTLDLSVAEAEFKTIEQHTETYIVGTLGLPNLPETEDVHCFVHIDGWIACYYLKQEPTSKIVDWNFYSGGVLSKTKLYEGLEIIVNAYFITITDAHYYHYHYQNANKFMIIIEEATNAKDDSFNLFLPIEFTFYEKSWNLNGQETKMGIFSGELNPDTTHTITLHYFSYDYDLKVDGVKVDYVNALDNKARVAVLLVYYES